MSKRKILELKGSRNAALLLFMVTLGWAICAAETLSIPQLMVAGIIMIICGFFADKIDGKLPSKYQLIWRKSK